MRHRLEVMIFKFDDCRDVGRNPGCCQTFGRGFAVGFVPQGSSESYSMDAEGMPINPA